MEKVIELFNNSGFTAVLASIAAVLITGFFNERINKHQEQQQFIRQILPERMKAHGDILRCIVVIHEKLIRLLAEPPTNRPKAIREYFNKLQAIYMRNMLWLEKGVNDQVWEINQLLMENVISDKSIGEMKTEILNDTYFALMEEFSKRLGFIQSRIRKWSWIPLIDKTISEMQIKPKRNRKKYFR